MNETVLSKKPFIIPGVQHLLIEVSYLVMGLDLRPGDRVLDFGCGTVRGRPLRPSESVSNADRPGLG